MLVAQALAEGAAVAVGVAVGPGVGDGLGPGLALTLMPPAGLIINPMRMMATNENKMTRLVFTFYLQMVNESISCSAIKGMIAKIKNEHSPIQEQCLVFSYIPGITRMVSLKKLINKDYQYNQTLI